MTEKQKAKGAPENICPYLGELDFDPKYGTFMCTHPNRIQDHCLLNNPAEWEQLCTYLLEVKAAVKGEEVEEQSLGGRALDFIKSNIPGQGKLGEEPIQKQAPLTPKEVATTGQVQSQEPSIQEVPRVGGQFVPAPVTLKQWVLAHTGIAVKGVYVDYYYMSVYDFNELLKILDSMGTTSQLEAK